MTDLIGRSHISESESSDSESAESDSDYDPSLAFELANNHRLNWRWGVWQSRSAKRAATGYSVAFEYSFKAAEHRRFRHEVLYARNIVLGAKMLMFLNAAGILAPYVAVFMMLGVSRLEGLGRHDSTCIGSEYSSMLGIFVQVQGGLARCAVECAYLATTTLLLAVSIRRPASYTYKAAMGLVFLYFWLLYMYPAGVSCTRIHEGLECAGLSKTFPKCREMGFFLLSKNMGLINITPLVVPEYRMMKFILWSLLAIFYLVSMAACDKLVNDPDESKRLSARYHAYFDLLVGIVFLSCVSLVVSFRKWHIERASQTNFVLSLRREGTSKSMLEILQYMLPHYVVLPMLNQSGWNDHIERASLLFIKIVGFEHVARSFSPSDLLKFLNRVFSRLDGVCTKHSVQKIETVAEEYMCAVGIEPDDRHTYRNIGHTPNLERLIVMAGEVLDMQGDGVQTTNPNLWSQKDNVVFQMGIHTGPLVAGIIGSKLPRFRLFGDTVNTAARMMQKGQPREVQFGDDTLRDLPHWVEVRSNGPVEMKGKGILQTYFLQHVRGRNETWKMTEAAEQQMKGSYPAVGNLMNAALDVVEKGSSRIWNHDSASTPDLFDQAINDMGEAAPLAVGCACGLSKSDAEHERSFREWFHEKHLCRKIVKKLDKQAIFIAILTFLELVYVVSTASAAEGDEVSFLIGRGICLAIVVTWRVIASCTNVVYTHTLVFEWCLVLSSCLVAALLFLSYEAMPARFSSNEARSIDTVIPVDYPVAGVSRNIPRLLAFPVYVAAMAAHPHRFLPSCSFAVVAVVIIWLEAANTTASSASDTAFLLQTYTDMWYFLCFTCLRIFYAYYEERLLRQQHASHCAVESVLQRVQTILNTLMPPQIVQSIRDNPRAELPSTQYECATVAQSDLCGFTRLASQRGPREVVEFISEIFSHFDDLTDVYHVYKVETVGDAYIAGTAKPPLTKTNSPISVIFFALAMSETTQSLSAKRGWHISCRVGVHSGACIGGVVGKDMQRYHLFGSLLVALDIVESTAPEGMVQVSGPCKEAVFRELREHESRLCGKRIRFDARLQPALVTSKGEAHDYAEVGGQTFLVVDLEPDVLPQNSQRSHVLGNEI
eukprot:TRINITY_DN25668_c0_g1_i1.p1 TRINITY_DN25668_c0_g1~~TRINITY_DN25668_c0_g1_i1.p1  ORF type:complete len:1110 (-),score=157.27 TRINITY_DN25668_c0_g1_i1:108-3437(-)